MKDELKAELLQAQVEIERLREALTSIVEPTPYRPYGSHRIHYQTLVQNVDGDCNGVNCICKIGRGETTHSDGCEIGKALETLQTQPTPGIGAAMLRVVEAAKEWSLYADSIGMGANLSDNQNRLGGIFRSVQILNELENSQ